MKENLSAHAFFTGDALQIAEAIDLRDFDTLARLAALMDLNVVYKDDMTLLMYALMRNQPESVEILVRAGANPLLRQQDLGSPLKVAILAESTNLLMAFLDAGISADALDEQSDPILFAAAGKTSPDAMILLIDRGANINQVDSLGRTAVYEALTMYQYDNVLYLLEKGADAMTPTKNGVTMSFAVERRIARETLNSPALEKLMEMKNALMKQGATFPAEDASVVREKMKALGMEVIE